MIAIAFRLGLAAIVALSLVVKVHELNARRQVVAGFDISAGVSEVVRQHGLTLGENGARPESVLASAVYFRAPGCVADTVVTPFQLGAEAMATVIRLAPADYGHRFHYLDRSWDEQDRLELELHRILHQALSVVDATPFLAARQAIAVSSPPGCAGDPAIDWSGVWRRQPDPMQTRPRDAYAGAGRAVVR